jgi:hypothetical protein
MAEDSSPSAYMPWGTFTNTLDQFADGIPNRIDKSVFPGQSGGTQTQLINGFKWLGLINEDGRPQPALQAVAVRDEDARKAALKVIIEAKYADLFALNLTKTTPSELDEQMTASYNVTGDTRVKAKRFFLSAAQYLGVPVSPLLMRDRSTGSAQGATRRRRTRQRAEPEDQMESPIPPPKTNGTSRSITLRSGGTLTLSATLDLFSLGAEDRAFVFELIDRLDVYEKKSSAGEKK